MKRTLMLAGAVAFAMVPLLAVAPQALASQYGQLTGNVNSALLKQSQNQGPADTSAQVTLFIGYNFMNPSNGMPDLPTFIHDSVTPGSPYFHDWLSASAFARDYAPTSDQVDALLSYLAQYHITPDAGNSYTMGINVTGTVGNVEKAFGVSINNYLIHGRSYTANNQNPSLPQDYTYQGQTYNLADLVSGVAGMTTYHQFTTHAQQQQGVSHLNTQNQPAGYTPQQMAQAYNAFPNSNNITGSGVTIGIATLAPFVPSDATYFWQYYHVPRTGTLSEVGVDGQSTTASGYGIGGSETSLDVERSGAMAPGSNIIVYEAPNTNPGFLDLFDAVATQDHVQVMSVSWGEAEMYQTFAYSYMMNQAFMQGAAEGITMMAASGDYGAYDAYPSSRRLAVDSPASSPDIMAVGGTTLPLNPNSASGAPIAPGSSETGIIPIPGGVISMPGEQGWGWSYLLPYYANFGLHSQKKWEKDIYPIGSGGGYSTTWTGSSGGALYGWWQSGTGNSGARGVPDVALNADPFTGYAIYDTNSVYTTPTAGWTNGWGGTSFASPQWAGIVALLDQDLGGPQGLLNAGLYANANGGGFHQITAGNNWYYNAAPGWNAVTGLGTPDVEALARSLASWQAKQ